MRSALHTQSGDCPSGCKARQCAAGLARTRPSGGFCGCSARPTQFWSNVRQNVASDFRPPKLLHSRSGTLAYLAPEVFDGSGYLSEVDWWSLGVTFYECLYNKVCCEIWPRAPELTFFQSDPSTAEAMKLWRTRSKPQTPGFMSPNRPSRSHACTQYHLFWKGTDGNALELPAGTHSPPIPSSNPSTS